MRFLPLLAGLLLAGFLAAPGAAQEPGQEAPAAGAAGEPGPPGDGDGDGDGPPPGARTAASLDPADLKAFRVCADPNNLPFSNQREQGFENRIAKLIADDWGLPLTYTWWPQRRGFIRETLRAKRCDFVMGVPSGYDPVATTEPYYRSTYVFAFPKDKGWTIRSLDDEVLKKLRIGVHLIGDDYTNPPPVMAMSSRGLVAPKGYSIYGDYSKDSPPRDLMDALGRGEIDVAIVWGPVAGYFAKEQPIPLTIVPLPPSEQADLPFEYDIAMGVRRADRGLREKLEETLRRKRAEIQAVLQEYSVPTVEPPAAVAADR
jgi:quinoprotein dehydrogenase-associated probable ABC transporter substrate-binding protein